MDIYISERQTSLTGNGTTTGEITVSDTTPFYPGTTGYIYGTTAAHIGVIITDIVSGTVLRLRRTPSLNVLNIETPANKYGNNDMSAYTTADGAVLAIGAQLAPVASINPVTKLPHA